MSPSTAMTAADLDKLELRLECAWGRYEQQVRAMAEEMHEKYVKPLCAKHGWSFVAGNGDWFLYDRDAVLIELYTLQESECEEQRALAALLGQAVPGMPCNDLGSLMPHYHG